MSDKLRQEPEHKENKFTKAKFKVKLIKEFIFVTAKIKGKKVKYSPDGKIVYPFDK